MMTNVQRDAVDLILATVPGELFVGPGPYSDAVIVGDGFVAYIDSDGNMSEATLGEWETGFMA
jgi:hypothetical protein